MQLSTNLFSAASYWWMTRGLQRHHSHRDAFLSWQSRELRAWMRSQLRQVPYYADTPELASLCDLPKLDKSSIMADFHLFNRAGITAEEGWTIFSGDRRKGAFHVGASTGTSGNRGLYVISDRERFAWLGVMLGKLLPDIWKRRERVAVLLPLHTRLYDAANESGRLRLKFLDLSQGLEPLLPGLASFAPSIVIAPPRALRWLAQNGPDSLDPCRLYAGAEVLDPIDARIIEARWPRRLGQIYMATEGLLATTCEHGRLHLAEDIMHFELEAVPGSPLVSPVITDFRRSTQILCRYRMNDLLKPANQPCPCGSPLLAIDEVVGRRDDCFEIETPAGCRLITPDMLRNAVLDSDRRIQDFRIERLSATDMRLSLPLGMSQDTLEGATGAMRRVLRDAGVSMTVTGQINPLTLERGRKLRRVADLTKPFGSPPVSF